MRVLLISNMYPSAAHPAYGIFVERHVARMAERHGVAFELAVTGHQPAGVTERVAKYLGQPLRVAGALASGAFDLAHLHYLSPAHAVAALPVLLDAGLPLVVTLHGGDASAVPRSGPRRRLVSAVLARAAAVIAVSGWVRALAIELGARPERVHAISMGCDLDVFRYTAAAAKAERKRALGLDPGRLLLLGVGDLIPRKGFDLLLEAAAALRRRPAALDAASAGLGLAIAGEGPERARLEAEARARGLDVRWLGAVPHRELARWYAAADTFVFPTRDEPLGLVTLEAMASGAPVLATRVGGVPEVVIDGENGLLVEPGDAGALAVALSTLLGDASLRARLAEAARPTAERHALARQVERVHELYREVTGGAPRAPRIGAA